ncbi:hypothetical protein CAC42_2817 [Sphaceloma murrayae]|uniref:U6 snRNA phosphodiesterase 1 n=1 Tax=Sphaceloma murrayae TaxID=2082308 RepID=A0A2K1R0T0_9PEZI|nr:hypothetical protein CAC42_2817 [Sphaceloma murrayae]
MGLVEYPESSDEDAAEPIAKRRRLSSPPAAVDKQAPPPLPVQFHDLYSGAARVSSSDDPSLHGGRKRLVPHVEGNWAAHVYLEFHPSSSQSTLLTRLLSSLPHSASFTSLLSSNSVSLPLHISLSAPLTLRTNTKGTFHTALAGSLHRLLPSLGTRTGSLTVSPSDLAWHPNAKGTRSFLVLAVSRPKEDASALNRLLACANKVASDFDQIQLYTNPSASAEQGDVSEKFHISIAWSLDGDAKLDRVSEQTEELLDEVRGMRISFRDVKIKIGRDVTSVPFAASKTRQTSGLLR